MALDVTEREKLLQQLDYQVGHDVLTGLPNRMLLPELLANALREAADADERVAVLSLDLDRFKRVNDVYGLRIGDAYIQQIAEMLAARMRSRDIIARTGGDEFTIVLTGLKRTATAEGAVDDLMRVFDHPHIIQGYRIQTAVSTGVAVSADGGTDAMVLWRGAESARGVAKAEGGGRAIWLSAELRASTEEQVQIEAYLRTRMNDGGLHLVYQPIYDGEGKMRGLEALLRLDHPEYGAISPAKLIPIAESAGLIISLGEWVIEEACRQLLIWKSQGHALVPVAVNVSGLHIMHEDFARRLLATLERNAIDPRLIHVEVTESVAMRNVDTVTEQMEELAARGVEFSIDDFGTGHSSLARLSELPASILKIDRSFLQPECAADAHSIVQAIITMAHTMGHKVVAEGVESRAQLTCLRHLHCDFYQGFLLSRPVGPDQIPMLLGSSHPVFAVEALESERPRLVERMGA